MDKKILLSIEIKPYNFFDKGSISSYKEKSTNDKFIKILKAYSYNEKVYSLIKENFDGLDDNDCKYIIYNLIKSAMIPRPLCIIKLTHLSNNAQCQYINREIYFDAHLILRDKYYTILLDKLKTFIYNNDLEETNGDLL